MRYKNVLSTIIYFVLFIAVLFIIFCLFGPIKIQNTDRSAIFTAIVTIFVFGAGLFAKSIGENIEKINKDTQLKRVFISNLKIILEGLKLQINNYTNAIKILKLSSTENIMISSYAELDYFEINKITSEDLYRIFIDNIRGDENAKINNLENLRKQLRYLESSRKNYNDNFEKIFVSIRKESNQVIDAFSELGEYFDREATRLSNIPDELKNDNWFHEFAQLYENAFAFIKISNETYTNFEELEVKIIPQYMNFVKSHIEDKRTPDVTQIFGKITKSIFQRKDTINNLIEFVSFRIQKYGEAQKIIESAITTYEKNT
jgi:hypothetical protein